MILIMDTSHHLFAQVDRRSTEITETRRILPEGFKYWGTSNVHRERSSTNEALSGSRAAGVRSSHTPAMNGGDPGAKQAMGGKTFVLAEPCGFAPFIHV